MIIITGVDGFIGAYASNTFKNAGYRVLGFGQNSVKSVGFYVDRYKTDIKAILHFGAISSTDSTNQEEVFKWNVESTINDILYPAQKYNIPIHFASSASIYGNVSKYWFTETDEPNPNSIYAESKLTCETVLSLYEKAFIFRYFNVYADNPRWEWHKHQPSPHTGFVKQLSTQGIIRLFDGSENIYRDFVNVVDVVDYHLEFVKRSHKPGIYNVGSGSLTSFQEVAIDVLNKFGYSPVLIREIAFPEKLKKYYQYRTLANISKITQEVRCDFDNRLL